MKLLGIGTRVIAEDGTYTGTVIGSYVGQPSFAERAAVFYAVELDRDCKFTGVNSLGFETFVSVLNVHSDSVREF